MSKKKKGLNTHFSKRPTNGQQVYEQFSAALVIREIKKKKENP
jgi:hypothetical protein